MYKQKYIKKYFLNILLYFPINDEDISMSKNRSLYYLF